MLYFVYDNGCEKGWHVGDRKPLIRPLETLRKCVEVMADGDELDHIVASFHNLPHRTCGIVRWKGEMAQFIHDNI